MKNLLLKISLIIIAIFFAISCKDKDNLIDDLDYPPVSAEDRAAWVARANADIVSLKNIVTAIQEEDEIVSVTIEENSYVFTFLETPDVAFELKEENDPPAPLVGTLLLDNKYYWTHVSGTTTTLIKDGNGNGYEVGQEGITPVLDIENNVWTLDVLGARQPLHDMSGRQFRAVGSKALFQSVTFDLDSNATIVTNKVPTREYILRKHRPFTLLLDASEQETSEFFTGTPAHISFRASGVQTFEFEVPTGWDATYELEPDGQSGNIVVTPPLGVGPGNDETGILEITAVSAYDTRLTRRIPVRVQDGPPNYASISLTDLASGLSIGDFTEAEFTFTRNISSTDITTANAVKVDDTFRVTVPLGYPELRKVAFATTQGNFDYYFPPGTAPTPTGDQELSIAPPQLRGFWQGGMIVHIHETLPLSGIAAYQITGTVMHIQLLLPRAWLFCTNTSIPGARSDTDGAANTWAIIDALATASCAPRPTGYIAENAVQVRDGGYDDWYLGALQDYNYFHDLWAPNPYVVGDAAHTAALEAINQRLAVFGGNTRFGAAGSSSDTNFWSSTETSNGSARTYGVNRTPVISGGSRNAGASGIAFREF